MMALLSMPLSAGGILNLETGVVSSNGSAEMPERTVISDNNGVTVTYKFSNAEIWSDPLYPDCSLLNVPGFSTIDEAGKPSVPIRTDIINIPANKSARISVSYSGFKEYPVRLAPARPQLADDSYDGYTTDNVPPVCNYDGYFPNTTVERKADYVYRGKKLVAVRVCPLQYSFSKETIRVYTTIRYRVDFINSNTSSQAAGVIPYIGLTDYALSNLTINTESPVLKTVPNEDTLGMLIVTTPTFMKAAQTFAEWKKTLGYETEIICRNTWTSEDVISNVKQAYNNNPALYSIVILGDHIRIPAQRLDAYIKHIIHLSDFNYGCVTEGQHLVPDLLRGRISVSNADEAESVVRKIVYYESVQQNDDDFYKSGLHCAYFQDDNRDGYADKRFAQTSEDILNFMKTQGFNIERVYETPASVTPLCWNNIKLSNGDSIPIYLRKPNFKWDGDSIDITKAIDNGVSYILHRGHGLTKQWSQPYYHVTSVNSLNNSGKLPVVFSLNCKTGSLSSSVSSFAEAFLRVSNGGCAAIIAATNKSLSGYNDEFAIEMFNAMYPDSPMNPQFKNPYNNTDTITERPVYKLGEIMDLGLSKIGNRYGDRAEAKASYIRELFHCFGDPTMTLYLERPKTFSNILISRSNTVRVNLPDSAIARISFYDKNLNRVLSYIGNHATYEATSPEDVIVSVTADGYLPYVDYGKNHLEYIQNETISGVMSCTAGTIKVGKNVTEDKASGDVVFKNGTIVLKAKNIELNPGTSIEGGTNLVITTN